MSNRIPFPLSRNARPISALVLWGILAAILPGPATAYELVNVMVTSYSFSGAGLNEAPLCRRGARMSLDCAERAGRLTCNAQCASAEGVDLNVLGINWQSQLARCPGREEGEAPDSFFDFFHDLGDPDAASLVEHREPRSRTLEVRLGWRKHPGCVVVMRSGSLDYAGGPPSTAKPDLVIRKVKRHPTQQNVARVEVGNIGAVASLATRLKMTLHPAAGLPREFLGPVKALAPGTFFWVEVRASVPILLPDVVKADFLVDSPKVNNETDEANNAKLGVPIPLP